jgi:hypothetical protein
VTGEPPKRLVGWQRVTLAAGQSRTVSVTIDPASSAHPFSYWQDGWQTARGPYTVSVGESAGPQVASAPVSLTTETTGTVGGTVPATLSLTLGPAATFGTFTPGVAGDYTATQSATVISTAGDAALTVSDPSSVSPGHLVNGAYALPSPLLAAGHELPAVVKTWAAPVSNDPVTVAFSQHIGAGDALRTGTYGKTLTFTLSTTNP